MTDAEWDVMWAEMKRQPGVASELRRLGDTPEIEADYRFSYEVGQRIMARPGFMEKLNGRLAELHGRKTLDELLEQGRPSQRRQAGLS